MERPPSNYFDFFGLPHKLNLDSKDLESRFYALSRQWHPDRFARAGPDERRVSEDATATLNDGYRTLREPVARAEYLLKEHGFDIGEQKSNNAPPELLEEVFELNMMLESAPDKEELEAARERFHRMQAETDSDLHALFGKYDASGDRAVLQYMRGVLNRRRYIQNLVRDVEKALA